MTDEEAKQILSRFYDTDSDLFRLLWRHSLQVADLSQHIARQSVGCDAAFVRAAALLHDVGVIRTHAPSILCVGNEPYIRHGLIGGKMLRSLSPRMEAYASVCERHTGAGLSADDIIAERLPLPVRDFVPVTIEEKIVCYADKFFSKSDPDKVKTPAAVRQSLERFGAGQLARFDEMNAAFGKYLPDTLCD